ncbi:hypothetical protein Pmani_036736, partial [Petrolisthes manimaculis]
NVTGKREGCLMHNYNYMAAAQLGYNEAMSNIPSVNNDDNDTLLSCSSRVYNTSQYESSVVTEWDLTCERRALYSTTSSIQQYWTEEGCAFLLSVVNIDQSPHHRLTQRGDFYVF